MASAKEILAKAQANIERGAEKSPVFYFKSFKPTLNITVKGTKIQFRDYVFSTPDETIASIVRDSIVNRNLAKEVPADEFFFGPTVN